MLYEEQTRILRRCFFDVQNEVGIGRQEQAYERATELWLEENRIPFRSKPPHHLRLGTQVVHTLFPDLVIWDCITVELKAVRRKLSDPEFVQIFDYLKCRKDRLGLLVNMGLDRVEVHRLVYDPPERELEEDWKYWTGQIEGDERLLGMAVRDGLRAIYEAHETGYGDEVVRKLIAAEMQRRKLAVTVAPLSKAFYRGSVVDQAPLECFVIGSRVLSVISALFDDNRFNIARCKSYLRALSLRWGIAANFGKRKAQFTGIRTEP